MFRDDPDLDPHGRQDVMNRPAGDGKRFYNTVAPIPRKDRTRLHDFITVIDCIYEKEKLMRFLEKTLVWDELGRLNLDELYDDEWVSSVVDDDWR